MDIVKIDIVFPSDNEIAYMDKFPLVPCQTIALKNQYQYDVIHSICAFLNGYGGYVVCGFDEEKYTFTGSVCTKSIQLSIQLSIQKNIVTSTGHVLTASNYSIKIIRHCSGKNVIIISVTPTVGFSYKLVDGSIYYRIDNINVYMSSDKMLSQTQANNIIIQEKNKTILEYNLLLDALKKNANEKEKEKENEEKNKYILYNLRWFSSILIEKERIEKKIDTHKCQFLFFLCNGFFNFFN